MRRGIFGGLLTALAALTAAGSDIRILSDRVLPGPGAYALDVRFAKADAVYVTTIEDGVLEIDTAHVNQSKNVAYPRVEGERCFSCSELAASPRYVVTAFPAGGLSWKEISDSHGNPVPFDAIVDIDVRDDRLLLLGSRREGKAWAPDGAIAWMGTLSKRLADLHPVLTSGQGPAAMVMGRCGFINPGAIRFFPDGSYVIVPGVEPGVFLYSASGQLLYTWQTDRLRIFDRCEVPEEQRLLYMKDPEARMQWINRSRLVDEVLPLPEGPALIAREAKNGTTRWQMILLRKNLPPRTIDLPFVANTDAAYVRADVRGSQIVFLVRQSARWRNNGKPTPGRLILAEWK